MTEDGRVYNDDVRIEMLPSYLSIEDGLERSFPICVSRYNAENNTGVIPYVEKQCGLNEFKVATTTSMISINFKTNTKY